MATLIDEKTARRNRILKALSQDALTRLLPKLEKVSLSLRKLLYEVDEPIPYVYFPLSGVYSVVSSMEDGATVEVATIGNEGMVGLPVFLGTDSIPLKAFTQIPGEALRMNAQAFRETLKQGNSEISIWLHRYTQALFHQVAQHAACNRLHAVEERCARWLLMSHDRVGRDQFPLTQEFLSQMLGIRRASVPVATGILQKAGLITYHRGVITILDREKLEEASCGCYAIVSKEYDRLFK
jgi:CRP-like cAMP-binding protein